MGRIISFLVFGSCAMLSSVGDKVEASQAPIHPSND